MKTMPNKTDTMTSLFQIRHPSARSVICDVGCHFALYDESSIQILVLDACDSTHDMVLVYDSRRKEQHTAFSEGRITRLYFLPYEGDHMFEIDDGERRSSWPRPDSEWFVVGRRARVEHTRGQHREVLRIWIGDAA